ncbi:hypothetical protein V497_00613 [Pseudogymnoascus sp. VKM F-4516 (FW-969)]|nr:hypothetical protein V497_00613 [Pseudogymnoascus sp. VKM F-4516 (FW-969)]
MPNHRFSIRKDREVSSIESGFESVKRHFSRSKRHSSEENTLNRLIPRSSGGMSPKNKHVQADVNEDSSRSNGYTQSNGESSSNRRHKGNNQEAQTTPALGQFTEQARQTIEKMRSAHKAIHDLGEQFRIHESEIQDIPKNRERIVELEEECRNKDEVIRDHKGMNAILIQEKHAAEQDFILEKEGLAKQREALEKERKALKKEKNMSDKRVLLQEAEYKGKLERESDQILQGRMELLDRDMAQREEVNKAKLAKLETDHKLISEEVESLRIQNQEILDELKLTTGRCDDLEIVKASLKESHENVKTTLQLLESEFALHNQKEGIYKEQFSDILNTILDISSRYFGRDLDIKDQEAIQRNLSETGDAFVSIPISNSEESQLLRIAYGQRAISFALQKTVWLPFSSEKTFSQPKLATLLSEISKEIEKPSDTSNGSRRAATAWKALAVRALHSMSAASTPNIYLENRETSSAQRASCRADEVVRDVVKVLSPLLNMSELDQFEEELLRLAQFAISVWASAEADEAHFIIESKLNRADHAKWRSDLFEPLLGDDGEAGVGIPSSTRERMYTLFPRITAHKYIKAAENPPKLPGSWHNEEQQQPAIEVLFIHHGIGLPEWSRLVVRGQEEEKEMKEDLRKAAEEKRKERNDRNVKIGTHSRSGTLTSISAQWMMNGGNKQLAPYLGPYFMTVAAPSDIADHPMASGFVKRHPVLESSPSGSDWQWNGSTPYEANQIESFGQTIGFDGDYKRLVCDLSVVAETYFNFALEVFTKTSGARTARWVAAKLGM